MYLPHHQGRYIVEGTSVFDNHTKRFLEHDGLTISIPNGWQNVSLAKIIALAFKPTYLDFTQLPLLDVEYYDDNDGNLAPSNLIWRFPIGGIESRVYPGYFHIPSYTSYMVNEDGNIISSWNGGEKEKHISSVGYPTLRMKRDDGVEHLVSLHRIMATTFKDYPKNADDLEVNHLDLDRTNCAPYNLEWVTKKQNQLHGYHLRGRLADRSIRVLDLFTGDVKTYPSLADVAREFNTTNSHIWQCVKLGEDFKLFKKRYIMTDYSRDFPQDYSYLLDPGRNNGQAKQVKVTHANGFTEIFDSASSILAKYPTITKKQLYSTLKNGSDKSYCGMTFKYV